MQKLISIIRNSGLSGPNQTLNLIREYLQILILKAIYQSKYGSGLSFMGGTCLRICYDLKRYSEDLDFALDRDIGGYSFDELNKIIAGRLKENNFEADINISADKTVQKSSVKIKKILHSFNISPLKGEKLHIKLEVDTNPVKIHENDTETFFVTKFDEIYPILKHTDPTLFAGKIAAVLSREYAKGRDFYDLIWYLNRKTEINLRYLNECLRQQGAEYQFNDNAGIMSALDKKISETDVHSIMQDVGRFLEEPEEETWIKSYPAVFKQAAENFLAF